MELQKFESSRLIFRSFTEDDYSDLYDILGNEAVCVHLPVEKSYTPEQVKRILDYFIKTFVIEKKNLHYIAVLKDTLEVIGYCGCSYIDEYKCNEIEYFLKPEFYGNKYASEMAQEMKNVAITLGLKYLVGLADVGNIPSQKILEKVGYKFKEVVNHWGLTLRLYELNL